MARRDYEAQFGWLAALCGGALLAAAIVNPAQAGGLFDFFFGGAPERQYAPAQPPAYAEPSAPVMPAPLGPQSVRQGNDNTGRTVAYCVRLCDGQHFPLEHAANATPVETCRAMCPAAKTKVFFGSEIGAATAKDGAHYADLDTAFIYRKQMVANCTCNGKDAFGLAPFDLSSDPTLRPGDIVSTKDGMVAYNGKNGNNVATFTPVNSTAVAVELNPASAGTKIAKRSEPPADVDDDPGTIAMPQAPAPPVNAAIRGPVPR